MRQVMQYFHQHARCLGACRGGTFAEPDATDHYERDLPFDFEHMDIDLAVDLKGKTIEGQVTHRVRRASPGASSLRLDAVNLDIKRVKVRTGKAFKASEYDYDGKTLTVNVGAGFSAGEIQISYGAAPESGLYFISSTKQRPEKPTQVWSQCQDENARYWIPCHDKPQVKTTIEFTISASAQYKILCNGVQHSDQVSQGKRQTKFSLKQPTPSYLISMVIGEFHVQQDRPARLASGRKIPVSYWVPKAQSKHTQRSLGETPRMLERFSQWTGVEYPYASYTQVVVSDFFFGGMENTTVTTLYEHVLIDETAAIDLDSHDLVAHELAHHWFGDWVTCADWPHAWLNEGFATYFEHLEREDRLGAAEYFAGLEQELGTYLEEARSRYMRPVVTRKYSNPIELFDRHLYQKGGLILHLLRCKLGSENFWTGVRHYLQKHGSRHVRTPDLKNALASASGHSLDRFFSEWTERAGHAELKAEIKRVGDDYLIYIQQTSEHLYELDFELEVRGSDGTAQTLSRTSHDRHTTFLVPSTESVAYIAFDPRLRVLGSVQLSAPRGLLEAQLKHGSTPRIQSLAASALEAHQTPAVAKLLTKLALRQRTHWVTRVNCVKTLGRHRTDSSCQGLLEVLKGARASSKARSTHDLAKVQAAAVEALAQNGAPEVTKALERLFSESASYLVKAQVCKSLGVAASAMHPLLGRALTMSSWADVVAAGALEGMSHIPPAPAVVKQLVTRTDAKYPMRIRRAAVRALARCPLNPQTQHVLERLLMAEDSLLRADVADTLGRIGDASALAALQRRLGAEPDGRAKRHLKVALRKLQSTGGDVALTKRLEVLEADLSRLKGQLAELQAKS